MSFLRPAQAAAVRAHLLAQATHLLAAVDTASAPSDAHPTAQLWPLPPRPPPPGPVDEAHAAAAPEDGDEAEARARVRSVLGWALAKRPSTVPSASAPAGASSEGGGGWDAGLGIVVTGPVRAGHMVAWYPGVAYSVGDLRGTSAAGGGRGDGLCVVETGDRFRASGGGPRWLQGRCGGGLVRWCVAGVHIADWRPGRTLMRLS